MSNLRAFLSGGTTGILITVLASIIRMFGNGKMKIFRLCAILFAIFLFNQFNPCLYAEDKPIPVRVGIYVFEGAEVIDFAAPYGVFAVARRLEPSIEVFLIADTMRPVTAQAGLTVLPKYSLDDKPNMSAFIIPGGSGTRTEVFNQRLIDFVKALPKDTLVISVCTGSWILAQAGLLDNLPATSRKEAGPNEMVPLERLKLFCPTVKPNTARVVDVGRIITAGGISAGMELGFYLFERHGYDEKFISEVARIMEYSKAREALKNDRYVDK